MSILKRASKQTKLKLKKGFHNAPISYRVLMVSQFSKVDKDIILKGLLSATTPDKAKLLLPKPSKPSPWTLRQISQTGNFDVQSLHYKGLEVAAFWRRQTSEVIPAPEDPVPEGVLEFPDDVWVRFDLFAKSPRQLVGAVQEDLENLRNELAHKDLLLSAKDRELRQRDDTIGRLQAQIHNSLQPKQPKKKAAVKSKGKQNGKGQGSKGK